MRFSAPDDSALKRTLRWEDRLGPEAEWRQFLADGKFMIQRSRSTGRHVFYPRPFIPGSGETDLEWVEASGSGTIYASTVNRRSPDKGGTFGLVLVDMDEGVRMLSRVVGMPLRT